MENQEGKLNRIVVVGGGFAGLNFVKKLDPRKYDITIIDRNNYHSFPPLFYQVASAGLDASSICFPLRRELRKLRRQGEGVKFNMGEVKSINPLTKIISTDLEEIPYDILVIAAGTTNNFFHIPGLQEKVYTLKSTSEALRCRNDILRRMEKASIETDPEIRKHLLSFIVIGGGPTGVEIAGALGEMKRYVVPREYPEINPDEISITLVEGSDRLLRTLSEKCSASALRELRQLMVTCRLGTSVDHYDGHTVTMADGQRLDGDTVIWTAGVRATAFDFKTDIPSDRYIGQGGRMIVNGYCQVSAFGKDIYAIGDIALMTDGPDIDPNFPKGHPQLAQPAIQMGRLLARNLMKGNKIKPFRYKDKGSMATVGRNRAVVQLKHIEFSGFVAWMAWMFIHLISILGFRNKLTVMINWIWAYFNYSTSLRLLIKPSSLPDNMQEEE